MEVKNIRCNFIIATPRTGSTLLTAMLSTSPEVISAMEEPFAFELYGKYGKKKSWSAKDIKEYCNDLYLFSTWRLIPQFGSKDDLEHLLTRHKEELTFGLALRLTYLCFMPLKDKECITTAIDKQLKIHNHLVRLSETDDEYKFIFLYRNPLDTLARKINLYKKLGKERSLLFDAMGWKYIYEKILNSRQRIDPGRILELKFEDLILNPGQELKRVCVFLGIEYREEMLLYYQKDPFSVYSPEAADSIRGLSFINEGITKTPLPSKIGSWNEVISQEEAELIWSICGKTALKMGYQKDPSFREESPEIKYYWLYPKLIFNKLVVPLFWYALPYAIKKTIKKLRRGKSKREPVPTD